MKHSGELPTREAFHAAADAPTTVPSEDLERIRLDSASRPIEAFLEEFFLQTRLASRRASSGTIVGQHHPEESLNQVEDRPIPL